MAWRHCQPGGRRCKSDARANKSCQARRGYPQQTAACQCQGLAVKGTEYQYQLWPHQGAPTYENTRHVAAIVDGVFADLEVKVAVTLDDAELGAAVKFPPLIDGDGLDDSAVLGETTP